MLSNKTCIVYDIGGLNTELAVRLAKDFGKVMYYTLWQDGFPKSDKMLIGYGLEGVEKVKEFWSNVDRADLIVVPDTYCSDITEYLRSKGYRVFGAGNAEILENDRWKAKKIMEKIGMPVGHSIKIVGFSNLVSYLKKNKNKVIKINTFRGDIESFVHREYNSTEAQYLGVLLTNVGAKSEELEFIIEDFIEGVEPGLDTFVVDGKIPKFVMYGIEEKGIGYVGKIDKYSNLPESLKIDKMLPFFKRYKARTFLSTEVRIPKSKIGYIIDWTVRVPLPCVGAIHLEIWENLSEFIWYAAEGKMIDLIPKADYGMGIAVDSSWAEKYWTEIGLEQKSNREYIKLRRGCKIRGRYYAVLGFSSVCSIVSIGNNLNDMFSEIERIAKTLNIREVSYTLSGLENIINKRLKECKEYGVKF